MRYVRMYSKVVRDSVCIIATVARNPEMYRKFPHKNTGIPIVRKYLHIHEYLWSSELTADCMDFHNEWAQHNPNWTPPPNITTVEY